jgi:sugar-phosphatase
MLDGVSLREFFPIIVAAQDVPVGKPDPRGYLLTMKQTAERIKKTLAPGDCLVVEDAPAVIAAAKAEGFRTLAVATSYPLEQLAHADWAVKTLHPTEIAKHLPQLKVRA